MTVESKQKYVKFDYNNCTQTKANGTKMNARQAVTGISNSGSSLFQGTYLAQYMDRMESDLNNIDSIGYRVWMDENGNGEYSQKGIGQAVAESFDSILDLYIQEEVIAVMKKYGTCSLKFLSPAAVNELAMKGIRVDALDTEGGYANRVYSFSLVDVDDETRALMNQDNISQQDAEKIYAAVYDPNASIVKDGDSKEASFLFADCLIADGYAQGAETHLSSILDQMGYECISRADFIGSEEEYSNIMAQVHSDLQQGNYHKMNQENNWNTTIGDLYGGLKSIGCAMKSLWGGAASSNYGAVAYNQSGGTYNYSSGGKMPQGSSAVVQEQTLEMVNLLEGFESEEKTNAKNFAKELYIRKTAGKNLTEQEKQQMLRDIKADVYSVYEVYLTNEDISDIIS